jgi:hypothetical protein
VGAAYNRRSIPVRKVTDSIMAALTALGKEPMALVMAGLAAVLAIGALLARGADRLLLISFAVISGCCAWITATHWQWPK